MKFLFGALGAALVICAFVAGVWCADRFGQRYQLQITHDGVPVRLDTRTGVVRIWTAKGAGNLRENDWRAAPSQSLSPSSSPALSQSPSPSATVTPKR